MTDKAMVARIEGALKNAILVIGEPGKDLRAQGHLEALRYVQTVIETGRRLYTPRLRPKAPSASQAVAGPTTPAPAAGPGR
jgi:hypothetical protein